MRSMRWTIVAWAGLCVVLTAGVLVTVAARSARAIAIENTNHEIKSTLRAATASLASNVGASSDIGLTLAQMLGATQDKKVKLDLNREAATSMLQIVLQQHADITSVFTVWEPDAFDQMDSGNKNVPGHDASGRFVPMLTRAGSKITLKATPEYAGVKGSGPETWNLAGYYEAVKQSKLTRITEARTSKADGRETVTVQSLSPIVVDGKFYGIVGVEQDVTKIGEQLSQATISGQPAEVLIMTAGGSVAVSEISECVVGSVSKGVGSTWEEGMKAVAAGGEFMGVDGDSLVAYAGTTIGTCKEPWGVMLRVPQAAVMQQAQNAMYWQISVGVAACAAALLAVWFVAGGIAKPVKALVDGFREVAQGDGDLTKRLQINRKDEIGELAQIFNTFLSNLQELIRSIKTTAVDVAGNAGEISQINGKLSQELSQQNSHTAKVAAAVEEMSASVTEVAQKSGEAANNAKEAGQRAAEGGRVVSKTVEEIKQIATDVNASVDSISALGKKSDEIGQIISVITDIADQTNLLALNAAIEAARAGEHGRGFAVVADEVRKLAERTSQATQRVAQSIREIQAGTSGAVEKINGGAKRVGKGVELAGQAGGSLEQILASSGTLENMVQSIASAAEQQSHASVDIAKSVEQISEITRQSADGAQHAATVAETMQQQAEKFRSLVERFKV